MIAVEEEITTRVKAIRPQVRFLALPNKYRAYVGGYGSAKTWCGCMAACAHFWEHPGVTQGYFAPTYSMIRDIYYPTMQDVALRFGFNVVVKEGNHEVDIYSGRQYRGTVICRSMENPGSIIGFKIGHAQVDEIDVLPKNKALEAWRKIIARLRVNDSTVNNGVDITSTPEGFKFLHKTFVQDLQDKPELKGNYGMIQASTYENEANLPKDFIPSLIEAYPKELIEAYLNGQFVNLTSGTVYRNYDRVRCASTETIKDKEPLFIGMDFNVQHMAAAIHVQRPDAWHRVAEIKEVFDTPDMIKIIDERWKAKGHSIIIYPDATGKNRESVNASKSDIALLQQAGFAIRVRSANPPVKDRINAVNKAFETGKYKINATACPWGAQCLEQQAYDDNGEPDKTSGFDHMNEAGDYFAAYEMPITKPVVKTQLGGF